MESWGWDGRAYRFSCRLTIFSRPEHKMLCGVVVGGGGAHRFFLGEKRGVCAVSRLWFLLGD